MDKYSYLKKVTSSFGIAFGLVVFIEFGNFLGSIFSVYLNWGLYLSNAISDSLSSLWKLFLT